MGKYLDGDGLSHLWAKIKSAFTNVQANWNEADPTSDAYILNKPSIPSGTVGGTNTPIYWNSGTPTATNEYVPKSGGTFNGDVTFAQDKHLILTGPLGNTTTIQNQSWGSDITVALPYTSGILALTSQLPTFEKRTITASNTSVATVSGLNLYTYGRPSSSEYLCVLFGKITAVNLTTSQTTVGTFSRSYAPSVAVGAATSWNSSRYSTNVTIGTTGTIAVRSNTAYTSGELYISAVWVVVPPDEPEPF